MLYRLVVPSFSQLLSIF